MRCGRSATEPIFRITPDEIRQLADHAQKIIPSEVSVSMLLTVVYAELWNEHHNLYGPILGAKEPPCVRCGTHTSELFHVSDTVWSAAGFEVTDIACIACTEKGISRPLTVADLMPMPWWGIPKPDYYRGILDGVRGTAGDAPGEYQHGLAIGKRLAANSTADDIAAFLAAQP